MPDWEQAFALSPSSSSATEWVYKPVEQPGGYRIWGDDDSLELHVPCMDGRTARFELDEEVFHRVPGTEVDGHFRHRGTVAKDGVTLVYSSWSRKELPCILGDGCWYKSGGPPRYCRCDEDLQCFVLEEVRCRR